MWKGVTSSLPKLSHKMHQILKITALCYSGLQESVCLWERGWDAKVVKGSERMLVGEWLIEHNTK